MKAMKRINITIGLMMIVWLIPIMFWGCAMNLGISDTPIKTYQMANEQFTEMLKQYNAWYAVQSEDTQKKWTRKIDPKLVKINEFFLGWRALIDAGINTDDRLAMWNSLKLPLINMLIEAGVLKE